MRETRLLICAAMLATAVGCSKKEAEVASPNPPATPASSPASPQATPPGAAPGQVAPGGLADFQARFLKNTLRADADHDGRVSQQEWMTFREAHPGKGGDPARRFARLDANHDGYLTPDEITAAAARMFARRSAMQSSAPADGANEVE